VDQVDGSDPDPSPHPNPNPNANPHPNVGQLFQTGVNAMLQSLDPYSAYENAQQSEDLTMRTVGR
jgi:hypothetical protein